MNSSGEKLHAGKHKAGYGNPPVHTQFRKGQSGNPGGRPRGMTAGRAAALALKEAYRPVNVREGDKVTTLPAIQAVLRSQVALAAKGNGPAQRALFDAIQEIEGKIEAQVVAEKSTGAKTVEMSDLEVARRIAFVLSRSLHKPESDASSSVDFKLLCRAHGSRELRAVVSSPYIISAQRPTVCSREFLRIRVSAGSGRRAAQEIQAVTLCSPQRPALAATFAMRRDQNKGSLFNPLFPASQSTIIRGPL
ncbi:MAG: hypothetical protein QOI12_1604 [Alphaproteobacteria bacterium]|jgi:hypothetical protein|nr:hypothetical protein [Alphaproteobacteria bacterium]